MARYAKTWVALAGAGLLGGLAALDIALTDNTLTWREGVMVAIAVLVALGVRQVPNDPAA